MLKLINGYTVNQRYVEEYGMWLVEVRNKENVVTSHDWLPNEIEVASLMDCLKDEYSED